MSFRPKERALFYSKTYFANVKFEILSDLGCMPARIMDEQVNVRFNKKMLALIDDAIETGIANDRSEFIRMTVAEKLEKLGLFKR